MEDNLSTDWGWEGRFWDDSSTLHLLYTLLLSLLHQLHLRSSDIRSWRLDQTEQRSRVKKELDWDQAACGRTSIEIYPFALQASDTLWKEWLNWVVYGGGVADFSCVPGSLRQQPCNYCWTLLTSFSGCCPAVSLRLWLRCLLQALPAPLWPCALDLLAGLLPYEEISPYISAKALAPAFSSSQFPRRAGLVTSSFFPGPSLSPAGGLADMILFLSLGIPLVTLPNNLHWYLLPQAWTPIDSTTGALGGHPFCSLSVQCPLLPSPGSASSWWPCSDPNTWMTFQACLYV